MRDYERLPLEDGVTPIDKALFTHIEDTLDTLCEIAKEVDGTPGVNVTDLTACETHNGFIASSGLWSNIKDTYKFVLLPVSGHMPTLTMTGHETQAIYYCGLRSYSEPVNNAAVDFSEAEGWTSRRTLTKGASISVVIPDDVKYVMIMVMNNSNECYPAEFSLYSETGGGKVDVLDRRVSSLEKIGVNYLALGDSITEGFYSAPGSGTDVESFRAGENACFAVLARLKHYNFTNEGLGGCGWLMRGSGWKPNAREQIDATNEDGSYKIDFTKYDLCTLAWGVNDWKGKMNLGSFEDGLNPETESVYGNMRYCIETIMQRNPNMKLIVVSPINSRRGLSTDPTTFEENWGIGYEWVGKTLEDYHVALKEVCDYYGIEYVDMLHNSVVNRCNAVALLPDEVHPSLEAHILMGKELAGKIQYGG